MLLSFSRGFSIGQSHDFCRAYSLFVARVASFAPERSEGANDDTRDINKLYAYSLLKEPHTHQVYDGLSVDLKIPSTFIYIILNIINLIIFEGKRLLLFMIKRDDQRS